MFKSTLYRIVISIVLLIVSVALFTWCITGKQYIYAALPALLTIVFIRSLYRCYKRYDNNILFLLNALDNGDYSFHFTETRLSRRERELNKMLNRIKEILTNARKEVIENEKFLSIVLESASTGIILYNKRGSVQIANRAAKQLLGLHVFTHINQLKTIDDSLPELFLHLQPDDKTQITIANEREETKIRLQLSEVKLKKGIVKVVVFNNIGNELEAGETESWIRLIRVMTHEIMNSIAPIISMTEMLLASYKDGLVDVGEAERRNTLEAIETINSTSRRLISFVESYREFTGIPKPQFCYFELKPLLDNILHLESERLREKNIEVEITPANAPFTLKADKSQIAQVLVNLIKNAEEAIDAEKGGKITIKIAEPYGRLQIDVCDNGSPISPDIAPHIFVPFFTTKETGCGIGLSISRYIMQLHGGNLRFHVKEGWTIFSMVF